MVQSIIRWKMEALTSCKGKAALYTPSASRRLIPA